MDPRYEAFTIADPLWYEPLDRCDDAENRFEPAAEGLPQGWRQETQGVWEFVCPDHGMSLPEQGWKIHVSATPETADQTIKTTWGVCRELGLPWKFLRSPLIVTAMNAKYASRATSGKTITVYPRTDAELHAALLKLDAALGGTPGPYVLSDLRWNDGPVSVRYGGFLPMWCEQPDGTRVPAMRTPQGHLTPDLRRPAFSVPDWAPVPDFLSERMPSADSSGATVGSYRVRKSLHFSNGGGVYLAEDRDGNKVVLKEARPHAGLDGSHADAVARLQAEYAVLERAGHLPFVPSPRGYFTAWDHHYLAMEYIPGEQFSAWMGLNTPLTRHRPSAEARAAYADLAVDSLDQMAQAITALHDLGLAFGDLHHHNVIIKPDRTIALVDYELSVPIGTDRRAPLGAPGFMDRSITDVRMADWFALGCCQLAAFIPLTILMTRTPAVVERLIATTTEEFPSLPADFIERMTQRLSISDDLRPHLTALPAASPPRQHALPESQSLLDGISAAATPHRRHLLFPADLAGHRPGGGLGLAHGAPGVLLAQESVGDTPADAHVEWLARAAREAPADTPTGLYDGLAGTAWLLHRQAHPAASAALDRVLSGPLPASPSLFSGLTGIAHVLLDVGEKQEAIRLAGQVARRIGEPGVLDRPGLMQGWSGPAVLFARCAQVTGDEEWAAAAEQAIRCDLRHGRTHDGMLQMHSSERLLPYVAEGSAGVALAALALPKAQATAIDAPAIVAAAARAGSVPLIAQSGLFKGRAGLAYFLSHAAVQQPQWQAEAEQHLRRLTLHLAPHETGKIAHGDQLMRLSTDLATGSAGVLLAMAAFQSPGRCLLPGGHPSLV
ncbi:class III lanthionine synthetase LanKC [Streptomyces celluloflavus]|uniref:class III lanthionine synthetase LanKC n=1 Tax=Streptomyces celluloflavus TaxID=58344 RepID=UPI0036807FC6